MKSSESVSRVLFLISRNQASVIYLSDKSPCHFSGLPSDMERAALLTPVYMTLQHLRRTDLICHHTAGRLLPHLLTLTTSPKRNGGYFLLRYSTLADSFLLGSRLLFVARTFLLHTLAGAYATNRPTAFRYKSKLFSPLIKL